MKSVSPVRQATSLFQERFGSGPVLVASAPGRLNLLGEHTDYNGGPVLPMALERRTVVAAGHGEGWRVVSAVDGQLHSLDPSILATDQWPAYLVGALRVLARSGPVSRGGRLAVASSVPIGAGLSSSAALTVAAVRALLGLAGRREDSARIAEYAYLAEHDEVGVHCGRMDQTIAAMARPGNAILFETGAGTVQQVPMPGRVWVFETGVAHQLTAGRLNQRRQECEVALKMLNERGPKLPDLSALPVGELPAAIRSLPSPWSARVRHVVTETARTREAARRLAARDFAGLGALLVEGHASLRDDFQSSCPEADLLVEAAVRYGAYGARLTGAGWGGAVIALLPREREARIAAEVQEEFRRLTGKSPPVWATKAGAGVRLERP